jgi:ParB family chromosome partitioning protein
MVERPQRGLGRGLSALLGEAAEVGESPEQAAAAGAAQNSGQSSPREFPIETIQRNPDQPRRTFTDAEMDELTASIREKGVLQPVLVRPMPGQPGEFQLVAGERRWRAAQRAGLKTIPVVVRELNDVEVMEIGIIENVQRADLNAIEEAVAYSNLMGRFGRTQDEVAQIVGKSRSHIANTTRLLALPESVRELVVNGQLSAGHARALIGTDDPDALAARIVKGGLTVRQAEVLAREANERPKREAPRRGGSAKSPDTEALEHDLSEALGLAVSLEDKGGQGELKVRYATLEQLDDICRRLMRG